MSDYRTESRRGWGSVAAGWERHAASQRAAWMPVTAWLLDQARLHPGAQVLELATGTGEVGLMAHELIQPGGELILSDFAPEMLSAAQRAAEGLPGVRFKQVDIESIDVPAASQDAVICRWGLMFLADPEAGVREIRRVLRPGGRVVLAAWTAPEENPWSSVPQRVVGDVPEADRPGQYGLARDGRIRELLEGAGFVDEIEVVALDVERVETFADYYASWVEMSRSGTELADGGAQLREAFAPYERDDGRLHLPGRTWVAAATA